MTIPKEVTSIVTGLQKKGFEAAIVGGCVRDFLLGRQPNDWDITTNAKPEEIKELFPESFYENAFLTVTVHTDSKEDSVKEIEVTTYRSDATYSDKRHPDEVSYARTLEEDLARRDFTINAMALVTDMPAHAGKSKKIVTDPFDGQKDLKARIIKTVGDPKVRFEEDALRMLRAVRFACQLDFTIEKNTADAIIKNSKWLAMVSQERIRDELVKIIMSDKAADGIEMLRQYQLLEFVMPELLENYGVSQNKHHIYDCYEHALKALEFSTKKKTNFEVRLASLLHDVGKPRSKAGEGKDSTFYNHEVIGAKMAFVMLNRLKFSKKTVEKVVKLVRYHLFYYNVDEVKEASVRRLIKNVGADTVDELLQVRQADRIGSGVPKAEPYKLRHLKYLIDKVSQDPISAKMLKVNGNDLMKELQLPAGPKIGQLLDVLLSEVLDDPKKNDKKWLLKKAEELSLLSEKELLGLSKKSKEDKFSLEAEKDAATKKKYWVA